MEKNWISKASIGQNEIEALRSTLKVDRVIAELLLQRGISSYEAAEAFFRPQLDQLHDPFLMKNMPAAVERVLLAIERNEKILLFGDYDVDGTTAVAMMYSILIKHHANIDFYIPDRYTEGYGISFQGIDFAKDHGFTLIISLDCGIRSIEHIEYAKGYGIDFIVCDHHNPGDELPDGIILDPKQADCPYPYTELSGCGVGFKLLQALSLTKNWDQADLIEQLDLLALSIGADIVEVSGENRILAHHGIQQLNQHPRLAFRELITLAKRSFPITLTDIVFSIAPRINAAGRLRSGRHAVELMISTDAEEIRQIAAAINNDNLARRELDQLMTDEALQLIASDNDFGSKKSTVVFQRDWHKGVVGIVASRLIEKHYRPTIVLTESNGKATGSARTVDHFDIFSALTQCAHLLDQFGGHTHAAGLTLPLENLHAFKEHFDSIVHHSIQEESQTPTHVIDVTLSFDEIFTPEENRMKLPRLKRILAQFEPTGPGNMKPIFRAKNVYAVDVRIIKEAHLKLAMTQESSDVVMEGIGFNLAEKEDYVASGLSFDVLFTLETNNWQNRETLQLNIKDIHPSL